MFILDDVFLVTMAESATKQSTSLGGMENINVESEKKDSKYVIG